MSRYNQTRTGQNVSLGGVNTPRQNTMMNIRSDGFNEFREEDLSVNTTESIERFIKSGGTFLDEIFPEEFTVFERTFRRTPVEGMYNPQVSRKRPFVFELGAIKVNPNQVLFVFDFIPNIYIFSDVDPGDSIPVQPGRFGSQIGWDLKVSEKRSADLDFQLNPIQINFDSYQAYFSNNPADKTVSGNQANIASGSAYANVAGTGTALLPQRPRRYGPMSIPWTLYAKSSETVQASCAIFRPLTTTLAFFEFNIAGILLPQGYADYIIKTIKPPIPKLNRTL